TCIVNGGEMITSSDVGDFAGPGQNPQGDQGSSFTYAAWCDEMTIEGLIVPQKHLFFLSSASPKEPYYESRRKMLIKDMVIPCSGFLLGNRLSSSETVSNVVESENIEIATYCSNHKGL